MSEIKIGDYVEVENQNIVFIVTKVGPAAVAIVAVDISMGGVWLKELVKQVKDVGGAYRRRLHEEIAECNWKASMPTRSRFNEVIEAMQASGQYPYDSMWPNKPNGEGHDLC